MFDCGTTTKHTSDTMDNASFLRITPKTGVPPLKQYEEWLIPNLSTVKGAQNKVTGRILRNIVILMSDGSRLIDISSIVGLEPNTIKKWFNKLPVHLKGTAVGRYRSTKQPISKQ